MAREALACLPPAGNSIDETTATTEVETHVRGGQKRAVVVRKPWGGTCVDTIVSGDIKECPIWVAGDTIPCLSIFCLHPIATPSHCPDRRPRASWRWSRRWRSRLAIVRQSVCTVSQPPPSVVVRSPVRGLKSSAIVNVPTLPEPPCTPTLAKAANAMVAAPLIARMPPLPHRTTGAIGTAPPANTPLTVDCPFRAV